MKRLLGTILVGFLAISYGSSPAFAAAKTGEACKTLNANTVNNGYKFTCIKSGNKLVWRKSSSTSLTVQIPIKLPIAQDKSITFANAVDLYDQIPQVAWQNTQDAVAKNSELEIPTTLVIGPNTDTKETRVLSILQKSYRLWNGFKQPPSFTGLIYNGKDEAWAEAEWPKLAAKLKLKINAIDYIPNNLRAGCSFENNMATECWGGMAVVFPKSTAGFAFFGVQSPYWSEDSWQVGPMSQVAHEYTHLVQFSQWNGVSLKVGENVPNDVAHKIMPCWFQEGQANAIGVPLWAADLKTYIQSRDYIVTQPINENSKVKPSLSNQNLTSAALSAFLIDQNPLECYKQRIKGDYQLGYNIGFAATEVLVSIGGPQSTMAMLSACASGMTWPKAFQKVYGITWEEGVSIISKVLAEEYKAKPMR